MVAPPQHSQPRQGTMPAEHKGEGRRATAPAPRDLRETPPGWLRAQEQGLECCASQQAQRAGASHL